MTPIIFYLLELVLVELLCKDGLIQFDRLDQRLEQLQRSLVNGKIKDVPNFPFL